MSGLQNVQHSSQQRNVTSEALGKLVYRGQAELYLARPVLFCLADCPATSVLACLTDLLVANYSLLIACAPTVVVRDKHCMSSLLVPTLHPGHQTNELRIVLLMQQAVLWLRSATCALEP